MSDRVSMGKVGMIVLLVVMLCVGGVYAYLTATHNVVNKLSVAQALEVEVVEPNWDESKAIDLLPRQTVTKDPVVHNLSDASVWMMADVVVPVREIELSGGDGPVKTEVFSYTSNSGWVLKDVIESDDNVVYRYVYTSLIEGGQTTGSIFDEVTVCDYKNEQFRAETHNLTIDVIGYGIQADPFDSVNAAYMDFFGVKLLPQAFAVYSDTDKSLNFYKRIDVPEEGSQFEGKEATSVYTDFEDCDVYTADKRRHGVSTIPVNEGISLLDEESEEPWLPLWLEHNSNILSIAVIDNGISPVDTSDWFKWCNACQTMDLLKLNTSNVADMSDMFYGCSSIIELDLSSWNTSNVEDMQKMFWRCDNLNKVIVGDSWNSTSTSSFNFASNTYINIDSGVTAKDTPFPSGAGVWILGPSSDLPWTMLMARPDDWDYDIISSPGIQAGHVYELIDLNGEVYLTIEQDNEWGNDYPPVKVENGKISMSGWIIPCITNTLYLVPQGGAIKDAIARVDVDCMI